MGVKVGEEVTVMVVGHGGHLGEEGRAVRGQGEERRGCLGAVPRLAGHHDTCPYHNTLQPADRCTEPSRGGKGHLLPFISAIYNTGMYGRDEGTWSKFSGPGEADMALATCIKASGVF